jgi:hypothetical protein
MEREGPTQPTQPRKEGAEPIDIPVPKRKDVLDTFRKASEPDPEPDDDSAADGAEK